MDPTDIGIFRLAEQRLAWADQRQAVLAQNVANANTPGFRARDTAPFASFVPGSGLAVTTSSHLPGTAGLGGAGKGTVRSLSPNGNAVSLEDQLVAVADTSSMQELSLNLHRRYQAMFRIALGRGG